MILEPSGVVGLILAGGQARRMAPAAPGGDKCLLLLGGKTLLARAIARASPQVGHLLLNANGDPTRLASFGLEIVADAMPGFLGPLAGILAGFEWTRRQRPAAAWLASFACDCPFFPDDMVSRLLAAATWARAPIAIAESAGQHHPVFAVWSMALAASLEESLRHKGVRKVDDWIALHPNIRVAFSVGPADPFFNINTPEDLARAEALISTV